MLTKERLSFGQILEIQAKVFKLITDLDDSGIITEPKQIIVHVLYGTGHEPTFKIHWGKHPENLEIIVPDCFYQVGDWSVGVVGVAQQEVIGFIVDETIAQLELRAKRSTWPDVPPDTEGDSSPLKQ